MVKTLPDATRAQIVNHLQEAFLEINAAECLLIELEIKDYNLPVFKDPYSLKNEVMNLQSLFDFENHPND
jgi:hypothetical protein